ncbi:MFS transporter [Catellatospora tritici]|uniref:MFS transporter n=1 Tax=Catellatospora tritici TaxID=2851566 RepID=UPI001C2D053F|nr:MFS transporter [Catellatospora tritici]MBV1850724.1 MFS transporter [Catellatospora tritici]MBV1850977.1 MFS transporter [Catellatospora tritici]
MTGARAWVPRGPGVVRFGLAGFVNAVGTGVFYPYALIILTALTRLPLAAVGAGLTVTALAALPLLGPVGRLVDRWGPRRVYVAAGLARAAAYAGYALLPGLVPFLACSLVVAVANRAEQISTPLLAAGLAPADGKERWLALSRVVFNAGVALGVLAGSLAVGAGAHGAMLLAWGNAVSFAAAAVLVWTLPQVAAAPRPTARPQRPWRDRPFLTVSAVVTVLWFTALAVEAALPVVLIERLGLPPWLVGGLFGLNTVLLALLQLPLSARVEPLPPRAVLAVGALLHAALPLGLLAVSAATPGVAVAALVLAVAMAAYTLGELLGSQAGLVLLVRLAPEQASGSYLAGHQLLIGAASALTPALVTALLAAPAALWWGLVAVAVAAGATAAPIGVAAAARGAGKVNAQ